MLELRLLGAPEVRLGDEVLDGFVSSKALGLLAYLAVAGSAHSRHELMGLLWAEDPEINARRSLRVALSNLRKLVPNRIKANRRQVAFGLQREDKLDVKLLRSAFEGVQASDGERLEPARLEEALNLYRGDFLQGLHIAAAPAFQEWALLEREALRQQALYLFHNLASHRTIEGDLRGAVFVLHRIININELEETAQHRYILNLARMGDYAGALNAYASYRRVLAQDLAVDPRPKTQALEKRIKRLRRRARHNLPVQPYEFVGRSRELDRLTAWLGQRECRLATISGPGGVGKTRLAVECAHRNLERFLEGAAFVSLADIDRPADLAQFIVDTLSQGEFIPPLWGARTPEEHLLREIHNLELLLILDNFEHLVPETELLVDVLEQAPHIKLLITSRRRLELRWEHNLDLAGLPVPESADDDAWPTYPAVRFFMNRVKRYKPTFEPAAQECSSITRICQMLEGTPLGLELAAAQRRHQDWAAIARRLETDLDVISSVLHDLPQRQRGLRASFEHSWQLLKPEGRRALAKLAVFRGGFSDQAAASVAGCTRPCLKVLLDASLIRMATQPKDSHEDIDRDGRRYTIHSLVHQYAQEKRHEQPGRADEVALAHARYFADVVRVQAGAMLAGDHQKEAQLKVRTELPNLRRGWGTVLDHKVPELVEPYIQGFWLIYEQLGWYREGLRLFETALPHLEKAEAAGWKGLEKDRTLGMYYSRLAWFTFRVGLYEQARTRLKRSISLLEGGNVPAERTLTMSLLCLIHTLNGDLEEARMWGEASVDLATRVKDPFQLAGALAFMGLLDLAQGRTESARDHLIRAQAAFETVGDRRGVAMCLMYLGRVELIEGQLGPASKLLGRSLRMSESFDDPWLKVLALEVLGRAALREGDHERAEEALSRGRAISERLEETNGIAACLNGLGQVKLRQGERETSAELLQRALGLAHSSGLVPEVLRSVTGFAAVEGARGNYETAGTWLELVQQHPASYYETKIAAQNALEQLRMGSDRRSRLGPGEAVELLPSVVESLLHRNGADN